MDETHHKVHLGQFVGVTGSNETFQLNGLYQKKETCFLVPTQEGESMSIPFLEEPATRLATDEPPPLGEEPNGIVSVALRWRVNPDRGKIQPKPGDYRDIVRLPDYLRYLVYSSLRDNENKTLSWPNRCTESLRELVEDSLKLSANPFLRRGYFYLFKNGYLWRELHILEDGTHREISLARDAGKDKRKPNGVVETRIHIPYKINNQYPIYEYCYSEVQWSWARVNYYGGMNPKDSRLINNPYHYFPTPSCTGNDTPTVQRKKRMTLFELTDAQWKRLQNKPSQDRLLSSTLITTTESPTPLLLVTDPLGLVSRLRDDLAQSWKGLMTLLGGLSKKPFFDSALYAYHLYFGPASKTPRMSPPENYPMSPLPVYRPTSKEGIDLPAKNEINDASHYIDKERVENYLAVKERGQLRQQIRQLQLCLVGLLNDIYESNTRGFLLQDYQQHKLTPLLPGETFYEALTDYFSAGAEDYGTAFLALSSLLAMIQIDPCAMDNELDLEIDSPPRETQPGFLYISSLLCEEHILYNKLFQKDIDVACSGGKKDKQNFIPFEENDGSGSFRPTAFYYLYQVSQSKDPFVKVQTRDSEGVMSEIITKFPDFMDVVITSFISSFKTVIQVKTKNSLADYESSQKNPIIVALKMARATGDFDFLYLAAGVQSQKSVLGFDIFNEKPPKNTLLRVMNDELVPIFQQNDNHPKGFVNPLENKGIPINPQKEGLTETIRHKLGNTLFIHIYEDNADEYNTPGLTRNPWLTQMKTQILAGEKPLSIILTALSLLNLEQAVTALLNTYNTKEIINSTPSALSALISCTLASKELGEVFYGKEKISSFIQNNTFLKTTTGKPYEFLYMEGSFLEFSSLSLAFMGILFSAKAAYENFRDGDTGEGVGRSFIALGEGMMLASQAGLLMKRHLESTLEKRLALQAAGELAEEEVIASALQGAEVFVLGIEFFAFLGPAGMVFCIVGSIIISAFVEDDLTRWAEHGPFGLDDSKRLAGKYAEWNISGNEKYACQALLNIVISPQIEKIYALPEKENSVMVSIVLPQFYPGDDALEIQAQWECKLAITTYDSLVPQWQTYAFAKPYKIVQVLSEGPTPRVIKMLYYFRRPQKPSDVPAESLPVFRLRARIREFLKGGTYVLPSLEFPLGDNKSGKNALKNWGEEGWIYGEEKAYE